MKEMYRVALYAFLAATAFGQTDAVPAEKPPAGLEQAVRARVDQFYSMMLNHQYRKAEALIAEDTKDYYYAGTKPDVRKYEVLSIEFSEHFTHAKAMTRCTEPVVVAGFPPGEMNVTIPSLWKLEDGNWYLYEDPEKITNPSGLRTKIQNAIDKAAAANKPGESPALPPIPKELPKDPGFVMGKITVDKSKVQLAPGASETIAIINGSSGPMTLEPGYPLPGVEAKLDRTELVSGQKATLTLTAGKEPKGGLYYLRIVPTNEEIVISVEVK